MNGRRYLTMPVRVRIGRAKVNANGYQNVRVSAAARRLRAREAVEERIQPSRAVKCVGRPISERPGFMPRSADREDLLTICLGISVLPEPQRQPVSSSRADAPDLLDVILRSLFDP